MFILFSVLTDIMAANDPDNLRLIVIRIHRHLKVDIAMINHNRDEYPVIDQIAEIHNSSFYVIIRPDDDLIEMRLSVMRCILDIYPNVLLSDDMMAWNLSPEDSVDQVRQNIVDRLTPNAIFHNSIVLLPQFVEPPIPDYPELAGYVLPLVGMNLVERNLRRPLTEWGFHATVEASVFSLKCNLLNFMSKFIMNKVLADDETDYFNRDNPDVDLINSVANLSFFNVIVLMDYDKIPSFRTRYHANLQQLPLPPILLKELEDYCPTDEQIRPAFIW